MKLARSVFEVEHFQNLADPNYMSVKGLPGKRHGGTNPAFARRKAHLEMSMDW